MEGWPSVEYGLEVSAHVFSDGLNAGKRKRHSGTTSVSSALRTLSSVEFLQWERKSKRVSGQEMDFSLLHTFIMRCLLDMQQNTERTSLDKRWKLKERR